MPGMGDMSSMMGGAGGDFGGIDFSKLGGGAGAGGGEEAEGDDDDDDDDDMPGLEGDEEAAKEGTKEGTKEEAAASSSEPAAPKIEEIA